MHLPLSFLITSTEFFHVFQWSETGQWILSGSDDHRLIVTEPYTAKVRTDLVTSHRANIFSAKFLPGTSDRKIISCDGNGIILYTGKIILKVLSQFLLSDICRDRQTKHNHFVQIFIIDLERPLLDAKFTCHSTTTYELLTVAGDPNSFLSCGEDGTVRWFDLRTKGIEKLIHFQMERENYFITYCLRSPQLIYLLCNFRVMQSS